MHVACLMSWKLYKSKNSEKLRQSEKSEILLLNSCSCHKTARFLEGP